jgi:hypothetical protein
MGKDILIHTLKHSTGVGMVLIAQNITSFSPSDLVNFTGKTKNLTTENNIITGQTPRKLRFPVQQKQAERSNLPGKNQGNPCILAKAADSKLQ